MKCKPHTVVLLLTMLVLLSCNSQVQQTPVSGPPGYDLTRPEKFILSELLLEVSGIAFKNGVPDTVYAQQDEDGKVFTVRLGHKKVKETKFSKRGDYEDIALMAGHVYLLRSYGTIFSFPDTELQMNEASQVREWKDLLPDGEFESMFADTTARQLFLLCKQCSQDKGTGLLSGYILQWTADSTLVSASSFSINTESLFAGSGKKTKKQRFEPSALSRHPVTGDWYIVSSVNKLLVLADDQWKIKAVYPLDPARFRQPEGIAFDNNGNMYISNEGDELSNGNILRFAYQPQP